MSPMPRFLAVSLLGALTTMVARAVSPGRRGGDLYQAAPVSGPVLPPPTEGHVASFCTLNPEACLEPLPAPEAGEAETTADPWKSFACTQACQAGSQAMETFCEKLPGRTKRQQKLKALCFGSCYAGKASCLVFCRAYFGPPRAP
ncbi:hypothetical protein COSO111634_37780 [Corallococcus soli]